MCGIIGYIGKNDATKKIINTLERLEYRGYDSAGIAYYDGNITIEKAVGKINNLKVKIRDNEANMGIGHTRWATHGGVTENNAHPFCQGKFTIVHNGIIENYGIIKNNLVKKGYTFNSETDSEVIAALLDDTYKDNGNTLDTIFRVSNILEGSYAVLIINSDELDKIYCIRKDSPLIIGIGDDENFIVSDMSAVKNYTDRYYLLDNYDIGIVTKDDIKIYNNNKLVNKSVYTFDYKTDEYDKQGFSHYMLKEINEEEQLFRTNMLDTLDSIPSIKEYDKIYIVGCGSAYYAGLVGAYFIEKYADKEVITCLASEFRYKKLFLKENDLVIFISQSGETADTLASLRIARDLGAKTLAIVNALGSSIAREAHETIYTNCGIEVAVATTKVYAMQVYILGLLAIKNSNEDYQKLLPYYKNLSKQIHDIIKGEQYLEVANQIYDKDNIFFLGRNIDYAISLEGSLKLKEISYIHSEAYPAGELKHGTISLISNNTIVISIITDDSIKNKTISNIKEVVARGAYSIIIARDDLEIDKDTYDILIKIPKSIPLLDPILTVVMLQLISYHVAKLRKTDIDKPRNLAKSVTVE
ncbi:MAG: glutamine--fructose-6-phosphate transaminase (isomerizing) [Bacilli bacterium]|nr:glutamine--fructose-6-phosphate transaminase (isomerizing) [Bacilli bacterium]